MKLELVIAITGIMTLETNQYAFAQASNREQNSLTIGGRPLAPLIESKQLPSPQKPYAQPPISYSEVDPMLFLTTPELFLFEHKKEFDVDVGRLLNEIRDLKSNSAEISAAPQSSLAP